MRWVPNSSYIPLVGFDGAFVVGSDVVGLDDGAFVVGSVAKYIIYAMSTT